MTEVLPLELTVCEDNGIRVFRLGDVQFDSIPADVIRPLSMQSDDILRANDPAYRLGDRIPFGVNRLPALRAWVARRPVEQ